MTGVNRLIGVMMMVILGASTCAAQQQQREGGRRGAARGLNRGSLIGLLSREQVQKEMKLTNEQAAKVKEVVDKLRAEMREQATTLRDIEDREQRMEKWTAMSGEIDRKLREQLGDLVQREQIMRLYQIYMQTRPVVDSLTNRYVARRLELTDQQKENLAKVDQDMQAKQNELYASMRDAAEGQRSEAFQKLRQARSDADEKAVGVLTADQKTTWEEMKGEKFELEMRRGRRSTN